MRKTMVLVPLRRQRRQSRSSSRSKRSPSQHRSDPMENLSKEKEVVLVKCPSQVKREVPPLPLESHISLSARKYRTPRRLNLLVTF